MTFISFGARAGFWALIIATPGLAAANATGDSGERSDIAALSAGSSHTCVAKTDGSIWCWGYNYYGTLGDGTTERRSTPVRVVGIDDAVDVSAGQYHTCATTRAAEAYCWGHGDDGKLGHGGQDHTAVPIRVQGLTDVSKVAAGRNFSCAIQMGGTGYCWGSSEYCQLGNGTWKKSFLPSQMVGDLSFADISVTNAGYGDHACGLTKDSKAYCWGNGDLGQLGHDEPGRYKTRNQPTEVATTEAMTSISAGGAAHSCAITILGEPLCWGWHVHGQIGTGAKADKRTHYETPIKPIGHLSKLRAIELGPHRSCAVSVARELYCWGSNAYGTLGDGTEETRLRPVAINLNFKVDLVSVGSYHTCASSTRGDVYCWGHGSSGQLGTGTLPEAQLIPAKVLFPPD